MTSDGEGPRVNVRFIHAFCDDVPATVAFYGERLGMQSQSVMDSDDWGWAVFESDGLQLMFHRWDRGPLPPEDDWPWQPGDGGGTRPAISLGIHVPEAAYASVVDKMLAAGDPALTAAPTWRQDSYWGWTVRDPAGNALEIYTSPQERPPGDPPRWSA